ncbi:hypothetical protein [Bremerella cremea]|uniref:hypothetical protein n=1 Tax=Bremerella cremea TaxID=1031537 RepID=UPI0031F04DCC
MSQVNDDPFKSPTASQQMHRPPGEGNSGLILAVAIINYVFGGLQLACGACTIIFGAGFSQMMIAVANEDPNFNAEGKAAMGLITVFVIAFGVVTALLGLPVILAGYGVQCRREWGRILSIVLAVIAAFFGVVSLVGMSPICLVYGGYAIFTLIVLLNSDNARMFR